MKRDTLKLFALLTSLTILCIVLSSKTFAQTHYELILLESGQDGNAYAINSTGYSSGYRMENNRARPCIWTPTGEYIPLPQLPGNLRHGVALGINDYDSDNEYFGLAVTYSDDWSNNGDIYRIGYGSSMIWEFDGDDNEYDNGFFSYRTIARNSKVFDINNSREICGRRNDSWGGYAYVYGTPSYTSRSDFESWETTQAFAINEHGNAAGILRSSSGKHVPLFIERFNDGSCEIISGDSVFGNTVERFATAINDHDQIVGGGPHGGFYWEPKTDKKFLFESGTHFHGINNNGLIVGHKELNASVWKKSGSTYMRTDLNNFSIDYVSLQIAFAINEKGQIVGQCFYHKTGKRGAFLLTPAKEVQASIQLIEVTNGDHKVKLSWPSKKDNLYRIKFSTDLKNWENYPSIQEATGSTSHVTMSRVGNKVFFQVYEIMSES